MTVYVVWYLPHQFPQYGLKSLALLCYDSHLTFRLQTIFCYVPTEEPALTQNPSARWSKLTQDKDISLDHSKRSRNSDPSWLILDRPNCIIYDSLHHRPQCLNRCHSSHKSRFLVVNSILYLHLQVIRSQTLRTTPKLAWLPDDLRDVTKGNVASSSSFRSVTIRLQSPVRITPLFWMDFFSWLALNFRALSAALIALNYSSIRRPARAIATAPFANFWKIRESG
jgi:hypothetical protein